MFVLTKVKHNNMLVNIGWCNMIVVETVNRDCHQIIIRFNDVRPGNYNHQITIGEYKTLERANDVIKEISDALLNSPRSELYAIPDE